MKLNCDVVTGKDGDDAKIAVTVRDWKGKLLDGVVKKSKNLFFPSWGTLGCSSGLRNGQSNECINKALIESDNQVAIKLSAAELEPPWEVAAVVMDIRQMKMEENIGFAWIRRTANELAHTVASMALRNLLPFSWVPTPPSFVLSVLS